MKKTQKRFSPCKNRNRGRGRTSRICSNRWQICKQGTLCTRQVNRFPETSQCDNNTYTGFQYRKQIGTPPPHRQPQSVKTRQDCFTPNLWDIIFVYNVLTNTLRSEIDERFQVSQNMNHSDGFLRSSLWDCSEDFMRRGGVCFCCVWFHWQRLLALFNIQSYRTDTNVTPGPRRVPLEVDVKHYFIFV